MLACFVVIAIVLTRVNFASRRQADNQVCNLLAAAGSATAVVVVAAIANNINMFAITADIFATTVNIFATAAVAG